MKTPLLFLDTNVCIDVAAGQIPDEDWKTAQRYISRNFDYRCSPLTLVELLMKLHHGSDEYFERNQVPLRVLTGFGGAPDFLPFPGVFVATTVFSIGVPNPEFEPKDVRRWLVTTLRARSKRELIEGTTRGPGVSVTYGMDLAKIEGDHEAGKRQHVERLERVRAKRKPVPTRAEWGGLLRGLRLESDAEALRVSEACDAAYVLDERFFELAKTDSYNFATHDSDWLDMNQLLYLCDPRVHMVTREARLPERITKSTQRRRLVRFAEVLEKAREATGRK